MIKFNKTEQDEYKRYTKFINERLKHCSIIDYDGQAAFVLFISKEREFQTLIINFPIWEKVTTALFDQFSKDSMLFAKKFFRERVGAHKAIFSSIRDRDLERFYKFKLNFIFIEYAREIAKNKLPETLEKLYQELKFLREELVLCCLPLAVNRARIFYDKTPKGPLTMMDCVSIANAGLVKGFDKYDGDNGFHGAKTTAIIRMRGYLIKEYSETWITLYPMEQKILYKCRSIMGEHRLTIADVATITKLANESFQSNKDGGSKAKLLNLEEAYVYELLLCSNNDPITGADKGDGKGYVESFQKVADEANNIEKGYEEREEMKCVLKAVKQLELIEKKVIKLKGVMI